MILARKITKILEFLLYLPEKLAKCPNSTTANECLISVQTIAKHDCWVSSHSQSGYFGVCLIFLAVEFVALSSHVVHLRFLISNDGITLLQLTSQLFRLIFASWCSQLLNPDIITPFTYVKTKLRGGPKNEATLHIPKYLANYKRNSAKLTEQRGSYAFSSSQFSSDGHQLGIPIPGSRIPGSRRIFSIPNPGIGEALIPGFRDYEKWTKCPNFTWYLP